MKQDLGGQKLGQYELRERLGRGGMADVYKAFQPGLERFVAVKVMLGHLTSDEEFVERFRREARSVGQLRHAHIVNVIDFGIEDDVYYMVMEFIKGDNLKAHITQHPQGMPFDDTLRIASQIADALDYAHQAGMIHRDVKPANIMFVDEQPRHAILTDFGIAHILSQPGLTASGAMVGTPAYLSPEIAAGHSADGRVDLYGLGIIIYEMLTGKVPYEADTPIAVIMKHVNAPLPLPSEYGRDLPEVIEQIILKALMKDPNARYQTAAEMKAAIDSARAQLAETVVAAPNVDQTEKVAVKGAIPLSHATSEATTPAAPQPESKGRSPLLWAGLAVVVGLVIVAALALMSGLGQPAVEPTPTVEAATQVAIAPTANEPTSAPTVPTEAPTTAPTEEPTLTLTDAPPSPPPSPPPTRVAEVVPEANARWREAGLLSGLTPLLDEIDSLILDGDFEAAEEQLNQMLDTDPDNTDALLARSLFLALGDDADATLVDADRLIELAPESPLGYIARSEALQHWAIDDAEGSLAAAQQALALDPDNPEALWRASRNHLALDNPEAFNETLTRAEEKGAQGFRFVAFAGEYLSYAGQPERALPYLERWRAFDPLEMYPLLLTVQDMLRLDRPDDAYRMVQAYPGVLAEPNDLGTAAYVAWRAGEHDQAREWAETARALARDAGAATYVLGLLSWDADSNLDAAMGYFDQLERVEFYHELLNLEFGHELNLDRGRILMQAGEPDAARGAFQRSLETIGPFPPVFEALADAHLALDEIEPARESLRMALENTFDNPDEQQRLLLRIRELGAAAEPARINPLSGLTPLQDELEELILTGQRDEAENRLRAVLQAEPENIEALVARSMMRSFYGQPRLALADADRVIELEPESPLGYIARSWALDNTGNLQGQLEAAEMALERDPENPEATWLASLAHVGLGNWDIHIELLNRAIANGAQGVRFANFAGEFLYYNGEYERAQPYLEAWKRALPDNIDATAFLATNLLQLDRVDEAYEVIRSVTGELEGAEQIGWAAYVAYRADDFDRARTLAERALRLQPDAPGAHYVMGLMNWYVAGNLEESMRHFDALDQIPDFWDLFLNPDTGHEKSYDRGRILFEAGEVEAAIEAFQRSVETDARPYIFEALADAHLAREDVEAALDSLRQARDMSENPGEQARLSQRMQELGG